MILQKQLPIFKDKPLLCLRNFKIGDEGAPEKLNALIIRVVKRVSYFCLKCQVLVIVLDYIKVVVRRIYTLFKH